MKEEINKAESIGYKENNSKIAKNTAFLYFRMAIIMFASLYLARVVLNVLGVEDYGIYNVVCGFVFLLNILNTTLSHGTLRYYNEELGKNNNAGITDVFNASIRIQAAVVIIAIVLIETIGLWYINTKMVIAPDRLYAANWVFQFSALSLVLIIMQAPFTSAIFAFERMDYYAYVSIIDVVLKLGVAFLIQTISSDKLIGYGALMLGVSFINFILCSGYCRFQFKEIRFKKSVNKDLLKKMYSFSGWLILEPIAWSIRGNGSNMILNLFFGTVINAAYGIANQVASAIDQFCLSLSTAFRPQLMQSFSAGNYARTNRLLYSMSKTLYVLKLTICVPIMVEIESVLTLWLGEGFPSQALSFTSLTIIVRLIDSLNQPINTVFYATERIKRFMIYTSATVCCILPISYILFSIDFPPNALFVTLIILTAITQFISVELLNRQCSFFDKKDYFKRVVCPCLLLSIVVYLSSFTISKIEMHLLLKIITVGLTSVIVSLATSFVIVFDREEKQMMLDILSKLINKFKK